MKRPIRYLCVALMSGLSCLPVHAQEAPTQDGPVSVVPTQSDSASTTTEQEEVEKEAARKAENDRLIKEKFDEIDRNGDGSISLLEMTSFGVGNQMGASVRQRCWKKLDKDGNGRISLEEFSAFVSKGTDDEDKDKAKPRC